MTPTKRTPGSPRRKAATPATPPAAANGETSTTPPAAVNGEASTVPPGEVIYNPLKLSSLRTKSGVLKGVWSDPSRVPIYTRPEVNTWVRVRPGDEYTDVIDLLVATNASNSNDRNPLYVVTDNARPELERFLKPHRVVVGITYHDKVQFLWVRAISTGSNSWTESVMLAMDEALTDWISLETDHALGEYKRHHGPRDWEDPEWSDQTLEDVVNLAFRDRIIDSLEHPVAKRLLLGRD
jgi:hypothetical protein